MTSLFRESIRALGRRTLVWMSVGIVASLVLAGVEMGIAFFIQLFLKSLGLLATETRTIAWLDQAKLTATQLGLCLIAIATVRAMCQFVVGQSGNVAMEVINARLRRIAIFEMLLHPKERHVPASVMNARIGEHFVKASLFAYAFANLVSNSVQCAGLFLALSLCAWRETGVALTGLLFLGLAVRALNRKNREVAERVPEELEQLTKGIERIARNTTLVRILRTAGSEHAKFASNIDRYAKHSIVSALLGNSAMAITPLTGVVLIVIIIVVSQQVLHTPSLVLLSFLYLFMRFVQALAAFVAQSSVCAQRAPQFKSSLDYVAEFTAEEVETAVTTAGVDTAPAAKPNTSADLAAPEIVLSDVSFRYETERAVLSKISLTVAPGAQFAIVGPSGSGKSTLLSLVLGLLEPSDGSIRVAGQAPKPFFQDPGVRVGYVGAEAFLVAGSIRDNLTYGLRRGASDAEIEAALSQARLLDTVKTLPKGLEHEIGEDGSGLSAGQKQRLCLARAFLAAPQVLVLDEASANLDEATEAEIAESLRALRGNCTTIVVSHRPGIHKYADEVVRLEPAKG